MDQTNKQSTISKSYSVIPILSFRKADIIVLVLAIILGVGAPWAIRFAIQPQIATDEVPVAILTVKGQDIWRMPIVEEAHDDEYISFENEGYDITIGYNGVSAWFEASDCPDQTCVQMGKISEPRQVAVCVPNRAMLSMRVRQTQEIEADIEEPDIVAGRIGG